MDGPVATDALVSEWGDALELESEACAFWLALADTQWRVGRLEERVRLEATGRIESGEDLAQFSHDPKLHERRALVLEGLRERLGSPQRAPMRIRRPFRSVSPVGLGDVFSYRLSDGRSIYLRVIGIDGDERDNSPDVEVLDPPDRLPDLASLPHMPRRAALPRWGRPGTDVLFLVRYPSDPDPADRITIHASGTDVRGRSRLPSLLVAWTDLERELTEGFGI